MNNNETTILNDAALDEVAGGLNFAKLFGFPSFSVPHAPTAKSLFSSASSFVVSHSPVAAIGHALKFW